MSAFRAPVSLSTALVAIAGVGCGPPSAPPDAARVGDGSGGGPSRVAIILTVDPETLEDDTVLDRVSVGLASVHAPYDRGHLEVAPAAAYELVGAPAELMLEDATPGVYGRLELELAQGPWGPALELELHEPTRHIRVALGEPLRLEGRCDEAQELSAGATLTLDAHLDVAAAAHVLRESTLPAPVDGIVLVDERSAPAVVEELREALRELPVECDDDEG